MEPFTEKDVANFTQQLKGVILDKDRVRLIKTTANSYTFTSAIVKHLVKIQHYGEPKIQTALLLYNNVTDKQNYNIVIEEFFDEEKKMIRSQLNIK